MNYNTIGGVQADIAPGFVKKVKEFIPYLRGISPTNITTYSPGTSLPSNV